MLAPNVLMLDSGCVWGGTLTGVRLPGSAGVSGALAFADTAKAVRIDASAARASVAPMGCRAPASVGRTTSSTVNARAPHTDQNDSANVVSPT